MIPDVLATRAQADVVRYKNDGPKRKKLWVPGAMAHPAKGHIAMWEEMVLRYSKEGDVILDPMAGIGTTLVAALMGRNVVCVELEAHFVGPMRASWEKMRRHPMLGYTMGSVAILQGDARALPLGRVDAAIFSPPWEGSKVAQSFDSEAHRIVRDAKKSGASFPKGDLLKTTGLRKGYTRPQVDAVLTSPPYEQAPQNKSSAKERISYGQNGPSYEAAYLHSAENIGNLRSAAYWTAMRQVYAECWHVLKEGGILALVLKGFTRDGAYVDLPGQTEALLLAAGWLKPDEWKRELWSLSFWRILQRRRDPAAFDDRLKYETVLAFRKPDGQGDGVAAVITSPPYEGSIVQETSGIDASKLQAPYGPNSQFARPQSYTRRQRRETP